MFLLKMLLAVDEWADAHTQIFESFWFGIINAVTLYVFLNWTFEWEQEPGVKMRFMW